MGEVDSHKESLQKLEHGEVDEGGETVQQKIGCEGVRSVEKLCRR